MGDILSIDLATGEVRKEKLDQKIASKFIGGMGLGAKIIYEEVGPEVDPLGPDNVIVFAAGPLTGTTAPCSGRVEITAKSPQNGVIGSGNTGGGWGVSLRQAGYDALIIRKSAPDPVYIWIDNDRVEIRSANELWGKDTWQTADLLRKELRERFDNEIKVMGIGQAGENLVRFACVINEYFHAQARCGIGAVMGSKKLKAIAVRGTSRIPVANLEEFKAARKEAIDRIINQWHPALKSAYKELSDGSSILRMSAAAYKKGTLPIKNFQTSILPEWLETNTAEQAQKYITRHEGNCYGCPIGCFSLAEVNEGKYAGLKIANAALLINFTEFGAKCAITGVPAIWKCKEVCHRLGMDLISAASVVAFTMELYQRGIITKTDTGGITLEWGNEEAIFELLDQIAHRRGLGDVLADGSLMAAARIGKDAVKYTYTVKGLEMLGSDPRTSGKLWMLGYLDNPRGGDNIKSTHTHVQMPSRRVLEEKFGMTPEEYAAAFVKFQDIFEKEKEQIFGVPPAVNEWVYDGKAAFAKWMGDLCSVLNSLVVCLFPATNLSHALGPTHYAKLLSACLGSNITPHELMQTGERIFNLLRMYLVSCGLGRKDDDFPSRFYDEAFPDGPKKGARLSRGDIDSFLEEYYHLRGWDKNGVPTPEKLSQLGLV